jgi:hypothetical protein
MSISCSVTAEVKTSAFTARANAARLAGGAKNDVRRRTGRAGTLAAKAGAGLASENATK